MTIKPYTKNPAYWEYTSEPVLLLGGSVEDNLFQIADVENHLKLLASVGGNYVRCTMSSRDEGDVWPFEMDEASGLYDLEQPGTAYWGRFERFLELTHELQIFVQIEVWDRFDYARDPWQLNPFNPKNNSNFTVEESGLVEAIDTHPGRRESAFFRTVPSLENNEVVLTYQQQHVDSLLERTFQYDHVIYCMDNETNEPPNWPAYWAGYIQQKADEAGVTVQLTEMWDDWDIKSESHKQTLDHPERYSFVDVSQNNHNHGQTHWDNLQYVRDYVQQSGNVRPINTVKIYGANTGRYGTHRDGQERFWRNIFGGCASTRFHRPTSGHGLSEIAQSHIRSMRMLLEEIDIFTATPSNDLLSNRSNNEAYCIANERHTALFFPDGGNVLLDVDTDADTVTLSWLDIRASDWHSTSEVAVEDGQIRVETPQPEGYWAAFIQV